MLKKIKKLVPFFIRVEYFRIKRTLHNLLKNNEYSAQITNDFSQFPYKAFFHKTLLIRKYPLPWYNLQFPKITNLRLASEKITGTVLSPEKKFSFWKKVGRTSYHKGYKKGLTLKDNQLTSSIGGGLCQLSNALYWSALNLGFEIIERNRHSFDIFPDVKRTLPFGSGASVYYNYVDLIFKNNTDIRYAFKIYLDDKYLNLEIYTNKKPDIKYNIIEKNHKFINEGNKTYRVNELYRIHIDANNRIIKNELICKNKGLILYEI